ncbi:MAG: DUF4349 domain-containing protein [Clostridiales Family XIII bacterium]|jgi:hypothetical protein|nr:DUF4349 domain-containing protein [Clostridiales Family XIII bacterium]
MRKIFIRTAAVMLIAVMVLMTFAGCGAKSADESTSGSDGGYPGYTGVGGETNISVPATAEAPAYDEADIAASADAEKQSAAGASANTPDTGRKITFSATYSIETKNYNKDYVAINDLVIKSKGYIANEESYTPPASDGRTEARSSSFSLRIPIGAYDTFLTDIEGVGEVVNKNKSSEDLTSQYFDTETRIKLLENRKVRLLEYIKKADKAADIVQFESELSDVLYELDQFQGEKRRLDQLVDYATIDVNLYELITPETIGSDGKPLGDRAGSALSMSAQNVKIFLGNTVVFLAGALPILLLLAVIGAIVWCIIRFVRRRRKNRRAAAALKAEGEEHKQTV